MAGLRNRIDDAQAALTKRGPGEWRGGGGLFCLVVLRALRQAPLIPVNDPFLVESLPGREHLAISDASQKRSHQERFCEASLIATGHAPTAEPTP
jgi:hypothetical protein